MAKLGLTPEEEDNLKTICEYLFFDQYTYSATFQRFEQCFQPLFLSLTESNTKSNTNKISMDEIFKEICGPKKKYITCQRLLKSYLSFKNNTQKISPALKKFYDLLFNKILQKDPGQIGKPKEHCYNYSTTKASNKRECISQIQILTDKNNVIHGINMTYDDVFENNMFPTDLDNNLNISLEMNLGIVDEKPIKQRLVGKKELKEEFYRDAITHIFGTMNSKNIITFIGFKCISGKTEFVGVPEGSGFLFGGFGKKFHLIKLQMTEDGIHLLNPIFNENPRTNFFIRKIFDTLTQNDLEKEEFILDEQHLGNIENEEEIDKFITTPIIEDDHFFNNKLKDEIKGNDYKEVVNQVPRNWLIRKDRDKFNGKKNMPKFNNLNDALRTFDEEHKKRGLNPLPEIPQLRNIKGKKNKSNKKDRNKNQAGKKRLHRKKKFRRFRDDDEENDIRNGIPRWNGNTQNMANIDPSIFYRSKHNYRNLKNELARSIQKEILENNEEYSTENKEALLEQIFPEMAEYQGKNLFNQNKPTLQKKKLKKKQILKKMNSVGDQVVFKKQFSHDIENENNVIYSDALQIFNDFSEKSKIKKKGSNTSSGNYSDDDENLFGFGLSEKYFPSGEISEDKILRANKGYSYAPISSTTNNRRKNNVYISGSNTSYTKYTKSDYDPKKTKVAQENYKKFSTQLKKVNGVYLLQTMGAIIKAMHTIDENNKGKRRIFLSEKIKLLKLIEENEVIIDFLTQKDKKENQIEDNNNEEDQETDDEEEDEDILIPDEHPEKITSLTELEQNIKDINNLLDNKKLNEEQKQKLEKLKNLYLQQKNILIENETNNIKKEIINDNKINIDKIIKEEEQKRIIAEKENQKIIEELERQKKLEEQKEKERKEKEEKERKEREEKERKEKERKEKEKKSEKKIYRNQEIIQGTAMWEDPLFKPEKKSLCPYDSQGWIFPDNVTKADLKGWDYYIWARPEDVYGTQNYDVFHEGATCDDIIQGSLGDCYFLSVLGSLCKYPKIIEKLFLSTEKSKTHQYGINFYINGIWKIVLIDDCFPARNTSFKKFAFAYSTTKELWVPLLEKAWAKINGSYAKISAGGVPNEVFDLCSEAFNEYVLIKNKNKTQLWNEIIEGEKKNYVMTAGTTKNVNGFKLEKIGLTPGHAYAVLQALEINTGSGVEKVVKLRNPWGNFEFSGDWSDYSSKWTEELKKKYDFYKKNDGIFYMGYNDFVQYFITLGFGKIHENYITTNIKIKKEQNTKCQLIKVKVKNGKSKKVHSFLQLYQKNPRIILKDGTYQKVALCFIILVDNNFNYLTSSSSNKMHIGVEYNLDPDKEYYIFTDLNYRYDPLNKGKNHGYRITSYSEEEILFENVTENKNYIVGDLLRKSMTDYVKKNVNKSKNNGMTIYVTPAYSDQFPFMIAYFENEKKIDHLITLNISYKGDKSFCYYCDDYATEDDVKIIKELPGGGSNIVLIMKYTLSSLYSLNYLFTTDKRTQEQKDEYNAKINKNKNGKTNTNLNDNKNKTEKKNEENKNNKVETSNKTDNKETGKDNKDNKTSTNKTTTNTTTNINNKKETKKKVITYNNSSTTNNNTNKTTTTNSVFDEEGEPIKSNPLLYQYVKEITGGYILGLENRSARKIRVKLNIEGLELTDAAFKGRGSSPSFFIDPKEKKVINAVIKKGYTGDLSYNFESF